MKKNPHAQALGRMARGIPKTLTPEQRAARRLLLAECRKRRWPSLTTNNPNPNTP